MNLTERYNTHPCCIITETNCSLTGYHCDVHETNADEYATDCYYCNSGKGKCYKVITETKVRVYSHAEGVSTKASGDMSICITSSSIDPT